MGHSIYLADDEKSIRELLHSFLASDGYTVRSFESGDALLEAFRQEPAELVILDIMMPGTDGLTVCRELRAVSDIPIILLTAKDSELDYVMGISQGSDDYLTKPFRPTILLMKVKALLRRSVLGGERQQQCGSLIYDLETRRFTLGEELLTLTSREQAVLEALIGFGHDVEVTELLFSSLHVQKTRAMLADESRQRTPTATAQWRRSFIVAFSNRVDERLQSARRAAGVEHDRAAGPSQPSAALVLIDRSKRVDEETRRQFPRLRSTYISSGSSTSGARAGKRAGDRAELNGHLKPSPRSLRR